MYAFLTLVSTVISIYVWLLIAQAVLSWLVAFGIVNRYNRVVATIGDFLWRVTEPLLRALGIRYDCLTDPATVERRIADAQTLAYSSLHPVALLLTRELMWEEA